MEHNIYAVVITYNPEISELISNLKSLEKQVSKIVICNNSNYQLSLTEGDYHIIEHGENLGIAEAQSIGMKWSYENGADFVLQMDQDSKPDEGMVHKLIEDYFVLTNKGFKIGLIGPQDYNKETKEETKALVNKGHILFDGLISVDSTLSSGSLIPKEVYLESGTPDGDLFIDAVDFEYCWRIKGNRYLIIRDSGALLSHQLGEGKMKIAGILSVGIPSPIRHYYAFRNTIILLKRNYVPIYWKVSNLAKIIFKLFVYPLVMDQGKKRFSYMVKGLSDGLSGKLGSINGSK